MRTLKPITSRQYLDVIDAEHYLKRVIANLKGAGCTRAADRVQSTLKSVQGAVRHAKHRWNEELRRAGR